MQMGKERIMERYINADEAIHELSKVFMPNDYPKIVRAISRTRTGDVRFDIRAHWVYKSLEGFTNITFPVCSNCDEDAIDYVESNFCPHCGAQMMWENEDAGDKDKTT